MSLLHDLNKKFIPFLTYGIFALNAALFLYSLFGINDTKLLYYFAIIPQNIIGGHEYYRLLTAVFIHVTAMHFGYNMLSLYIFGYRIEKNYGRAAFFIIYIFSGVCGSLLSIFVTKSVAIGASGAIYGLIGAMFVLTYREKRIIDGLNAQTMLAYIIAGIAIGFSDRGIDNFGHIGGLLGGIVISFIILQVKKYIQKRRAEHDLKRIK